MPVDHHVQRMIEELKQALAQTIRSSAAVNEAARKIRRKGLNLHLVLSFENERLPDSQSVATAPAVTEPAETKRVEPARRSELEPAFRLSGNDVTMLESLGIDPTRRVRVSNRRRTRRP
jgi:hypothetical protein